MSEFTKDQFIVLSTEQGWIKKTPLDAFAKTTSRGLTIATLNDNDKLNWCSKCKDGDDILIGSSGGVATRFEAAKLRPTGRTSRGVRAMNLKEGDTIAYMTVLAGNNKDKEDEFVLRVTSQGFGKRIRTNEFQATGRGLKGVIAIKFKKTALNSDMGDRMSCFCIVKEGEEILSKGVMVRQKVSKIPSFNGSMGEIKSQVSVLFPCNNTVQTTKRLKTQ